MIAAIKMKIRTMLDISAMTNEEAKVSASKDSLCSLFILNNSAAGFE